MTQSVIVWDLETVPDLSGFAAANDLGGKSEVEIREAIGDKFPKHIYHSIICIGDTRVMRFYEAVTSQSYPARSSRIKLSSSRTVLNIAPGPNLFGVHCSGLLDLETSSDVNDSNNFIPVRRIGSQIYVYHSLDQGVCAKR
jgi:hypothetical protein